MDDKLEKILRKWKGNANPHEQAVARGKAEQRAAQVGLSFDEAVAQLDALDRQPQRQEYRPKPKAKPQAWKPKPKTTASPPYLLTEHEVRIIEAVQMWREVDPVTGWSSNFGPLGGSVPAEAMKRALRAVAMPQTFGQALDELARWERLVDQRDAKPRTAALDPIIWARIREVQGWATFDIELFRPEDIRDRAKLILSMTAPTNPVHSSLYALVRDLEQMTLWSNKTAAE